MCNTGFVGDGFTCTGLETGIEIRYRYTELLLQKHMACMNKHSNCIYHNIIIINI